MKFRKKPVEISATQWFKQGDHPEVHACGPSDFARLLHGATSTAQSWTWAACGVVGTLEGQHIVEPGDWIITGVKGEHYPCKPDIFAMTYDQVTDEQIGQNSQGIGITLPALTALRASCEV